MAKSKLLLSLVGLLVFGVCFLASSHFVGENVKTPLAIPISNLSANCNAKPVAAFEMCLCDGPEEIHWQENAYNSHGYIGFPFAVSKNADCGSAPDNNVAATLDTQSKLVLPAVAALIAMLIVAKRSRNV